MTLIAVLKSFKYSTQQHSRRKTVSLSAVAVEAVEQRCLLSAVTGCACSDDDEMLVEKPTGPQSSNYPGRPVQSAALFSGTH